MGAVFFRRAFWPFVPTTENDLTVSFVFVLGTQNGALSIDRGLSLPLHCLSIDLRYMQLHKEIWTQEWGFQALFCSYRWHVQWFQYFRAAFANLNCMILHVFFLIFLSDILVCPRRAHNKNQCTWTLPFMNTRYNNIIYIPYSSRSNETNMTVFFRFTPFLFWAANCLTTSNMAATPAPLSSTPGVNYETY